MFQAGPHKVRSFRRLLHPGEVVLPLGPGRLAGGSTSFRVQDGSLEAHAPKLNEAERGFLRAPAPRFCTPPLPRAPPAPLQGLVGAFSGRSETFPCAPCAHHHAAQSVVGLWGMERPISRVNMPQYLHLHLRSQLTSRSQARRETLQATSCPAVQDSNSLRHVCYSVRGVKSHQKLEECTEECTEEYKRHSEMK